MNLLPTLAAPTQAIAHALGWTLLHFLWQGTLIAIILACILALLSERAAQQRYIAACTALLLMIATPVITFVRLLAQQYREAHAVTTFITLDPITVRATGTLSEPFLYRLTSALDHSMPVLLALWFAGVLLLLGRLSMGLIIAKRMKSLATEPPPRELLSIFHRLTHRIGVSRPVRLLHSALVQVPTVIGWLRPVVLIPVGCLAGLSPTQLEAILAHELAHIRRHDYLISVLQSLVESLLFYHPAVWWVSRRIRTEREHCCDDLAVRIGGDPLTYARALSLLAERSASLPAIALGANGGILTMRIKRLLTPKEGPATSQLAAITLLGIVIAAIGLCIGTAARAQSSRNQSQPTPVATPSPTVLAEAAPTPLRSASSQQRTTSNHPLVTSTQSPTIPSSYEKWLDQDARWIITPSERATFLQLATDQDRDLFIQNFWDSRNPPNSAPNTARAEHYQRIAYANQHFAEGNTPGWQTDRGRMYIINGQPDSIDHLPAIGAYPHPSEIWHYTSKPGSDNHFRMIQIRFTDLCNCGSYQFKPLLDPDMSQARPQPATPQPATPSPKPASSPSPKAKPVSYTPAPAPQSPSTDPKPLKVKSGIMTGQIVSRVNPVYPPDAKAAHVEGAVVLRAVISATGDITNLEVISGPEMLMKSATDAVSQWKYKPYLLNGQPTEVETTITVNYTFETAPPPSPDDQSATNAPGKSVTATMASTSTPPPNLAAVQPKHIGGSVSAPVVTYQVMPEFSEQAKKEKFDGGKVIVRLWVDQNGNPEHVYVLRGVGHGLDEEAVKAVQQYKFTPAMENGKPVLVQLNIEVNFQRF